MKVIKTETPATNLEWTETLLSGKRVTLAVAEKAVAKLGDGWRLPTDEELLSIVDRAHQDPACDTKKFPDAESWPYWTGTPCAWNGKARWVVYFSLGSVGYSGGGFSACIRACRASQ